MYIKVITLKGEIIMPKMTWDEKKEEANKRSNIKLTQSDREEIVRLRDEEGMSFFEISRVMHVSGAWCGTVYKKETHERK